MSFYETDFGWGNPVWASSASLATKNGILLMDTKCGKGIEAWVSLNEEDMSRFECDLDLLSFTSTN
ncbi:vinorine synthase-like [Thalictrum thalictroides]|uniref:Vinorine synthase-like n=1 Tax=Thalictrum thalictroides TaxID=46969 RepID=A0A7J6UTE3_THATH|nr:vinorine synthase-like [Thalictrum thalictroides]